MRNINRLAAAGATVALAVLLAGCGGAAPGPAAHPAAPPPSPTRPAAPTRPSQPSQPAGQAEPAPSSQPEAAGAPGGVTTEAQVFGPGCGALGPGAPGTMAGHPVVAAATTSPLLTSLVTVVQKADLVAGLNQQPAGTVFAPDDQAFAVLRDTMGADKFNAWLADQNELTDTLKNHLVSSRYDRAELVRAGSVPTQEGGSLQVKVAEGGAVTVTDNAGHTATVVCGNIPTANMTVFVIDRVLGP